MTQKTKIKQSAKFTASQHSFKNYFEHTYNNRFPAINENFYQRTSIRKSSSCLPKPLKVAECSQILRFEHKWSHRRHFTRWKSAIWRVIRRRERNSTVAIWIGKDYWVYPTQSRRIITLSVLNVPQVTSAKSLMWFEESLNSFVILSKIQRIQRKDCQQAINNRHKRMNQNKEIYLRKPYQVQQVSHLVPISRQLIEKQKLQICLSMQ